MSFTEMKEMLRKLFTEHAVYTKFFIESSLNSSPDVDVITNRLLQNQKDIGNYLKPIIGTNKGNELAKLLTQHILFAADAVNAIKNNTQVDIYVKKVFMNSSAISNFLNKLNPSALPFDIVQKMFNDHNKYVLTMATLHVNKKYEEEIKEYDSYYNHMMLLSDTLDSALEKKTNYLFGIIIFVVIIVLGYKYLSYYYKI